jgi:hypothetical protein
MRRKLVLFAALAVGWTTVVSSDAGQMATSSAVGGNSGGAFFGGFMPANIVNTPINVSGAAMPMNLQSAMMPQQQSTKVFNINSAIRNVHVPVFRSIAPSTPVVQPGQGNPLQPANPIQLQPLKVQPSTTPPWYIPSGN